MNRITNAGANRVRQCFAGRTRGIFRAVTVAMAAVVLLGSAAEGAEKGQKTQSNANAPAIWTKEVFLHVSYDGKFVATANKKNVTLWDVESGNKVRTLSHSKNVGAGYFSPDGKRLVVGRRFGGQYADRFEFGGMPLKLWDVESGRDIDIGSVNDRKKMHVQGFSPDGKRLVVWHRGENVFKVFDAENGREVLTTDRTTKYGVRFVISLDGKYLLHNPESEDKNTEVKSFVLYGVESGERIKTINTPYKNVRLGGYITDVRFSSDGKKIILVVAKSSNIGGSGHGDVYMTFSNLSIKIWDINSDSETNSFDVENANTLIWTPDHKYALAYDNFRSAYRLNLETGEKTTPMSIPFFNRYFPTTVMIMPDGKRMVAVFPTVKSGSIKNNTVSLLDIESQKEISSFSIGDRGSFFYIFLSNDLRQAAIRTPNYIKLWNVENGKEIKSFYGHDKIIEYVSFNMDGNRLITRCIGKEVKVWKLPSLSKPSTPTAQASQPPPPTIEPPAENP